MHYQGVSSKPTEHQNYKQALHNLLTGKLRCGRSIKTKELNQVLEYLPVGSKHLNTMGNDGKHRAHELAALIGLRKGDKYQKTAGLVDRLIGVAERPEEALPVAGSLAPAPGIGSYTRERFEAELDAWVCDNETEPGPYAEAKGKILECFDSHHADLELNNLAITNFPPCIVALRDHVTTLSLHGCQLIKLPEFVRQFANLTSLNVGNNILDELPNWTGELKNLEDLFLDHNEFIVFPVALRSLSSLKTLALNDNQLSDVPRWISELQKLTNLVVFNNHFTDFPEVLSELKEKLKRGKSELSFSI